MASLVTVSPSASRVAQTGGIACADVVVAATIGAGADTMQWVPESDAAARTGTWLGALPDAGAIYATADDADAPTLTIPLRLDSGTQQLWVRMSAADAGRDSYHTKLGSAAWRTYNGYPSPGSTTWVLVGDDAVSGDVDLIIQAREDGCRIDAVLVTTDAGYDPNTVNGGLGPDASPTATEQPSLITAGGVPVTSGAFYEDTTSTLEVFLPLQNNVSDNVVTNSGTAGDLTLSGATTSQLSGLGPGKGLNKALVFTGDNSQFINTGQAIDYSGPFTLGAWVRFDNVLGSNCLWGADGNNNYTWSSGTGNRNDLSLGGFTIPGERMLPVVGTVTEWRHVVFVHDGSGDVETFVDGVIAGLSDMSSMPSASVTGVIARRQFSDALSGAVAGFIQHPAAISTAEVAALYAGSPPTVTSVTLDDTGLATISATGFPDQGSLLYDFILDELIEGNWTSVAQSLGSTTNTAQFPLTTGSLYRVWGSARNSGGSSQPIVAVAGSGYAQLISEATISLPFQDDASNNTIVNRVGSNASLYGGTGQAANTSTRTVDGPNLWLPKALDITSHSIELEADGRALTNQMDEVTFAGWIKPDSLASNSRIATWVENADTSSRVWLLAKTDGDLELSIEAPDGSAQSFDAPSALTEGEWSFVVMSASVSRDQGISWVNGVRNDAVGLNWSNTETEGTDSLRATVGARPFGSSGLDFRDSFPGAIADFNVWKGKVFENIEEESLRRGPAFGLTYDDVVSTAIFHAPLNDNVSSSPDYESLVAGATHRWGVSEATDTPNDQNGSLNGVWALTGSDPAYVDGPFGGRGFDHAAGRIDVPVSATTRPQGDDWSLSLWFRLKATGVDANVIRCGGSLSTRPNWNVYVASSGTVDFWFVGGEENTDGTRLIFRSSTTIADTDWHHVSVSIDRTAETAVVRLDNALVPVLIGSPSGDGGDTTGIVPDYPVELRIGSDFNGNVETNVETYDVQVYDGVSLSADIAALLYAGPEKFQVTNLQGTNASLLGGDTTADLYQADGPPNLPGSLVLDGTADTIRDESGVDSLIHGSTEFSLSCWFKGSNPQSLLRAQDGGFIVMYWDQTDSAILSFDGSTGSGLVWPASVIDGEWHHMALSWKRNTPNGFAIYVDGELHAQRDSSFANLPGQFNPFYVGSLNAGAGGNAEYTNGAVRDALIWGKFLTALDWQAVYNAPAIPDLDTPCYAFRPAFRDAFTRSFR